MQVAGCGCRMQDRLQDAGYKLQDVDVGCLYTEALCIFNLHLSKVKEGEKLRED